MNNKVLQNKTKTKKYFIYFTFLTRKLSYAGYLICVLIFSKLK